MIRRPMLRRRGWSSQDSSFDQSEWPVRIRDHQDTVVPQRMSIQDVKSSFYPTQYMLRRQEQQTGYFDNALSKMEPEKIKKIKDEHKASQKVYSVPVFSKIEKQPLTRLEKNMMMFKKIFIEPEVRRIEGLKDKGKEFSNLVHNVINDQYDKLLEVQFKKLGNKKDRRPNTAAPGIAISNAQRPMSSMSRTASHKE